MGYSNRLGGLQGTAYTGTNANQPPNWTFETTNPTQYDINNAIGDLWMNTNLPNLGPWVLVSLQGTATSKGPLATWVPWGGGILSETGNSGGKVYGDVNRNLNIVGDGVTVDVIGNPSTNTLTISAIGSGTTESLTGNTGLAVFPLLGNINVVGDGVTITIAGDPATHTLTATAGGTVATSFVENTGTAIPSAGVLNVVGIGGCTTDGSGNTITINAGAPSGIPWILITSASAAMDINEGYVADRATLVTLTLPAVAAFGTVLRVSGYGVGGWKIVQNAGQYINFGVLTTTTTTGSLASTQRFDAIEMVCVVDSTIWNVISSVGNITVV